MATQPCCQPCEKHAKQWEIAQNTLDLLRSEVGERRVRENEATERERCAKDQLHALVRRAQELQRILDEVKHEYPALWAFLPVNEKNAEPQKTSQETAEAFPPTPAQIISSRPVPHDVPGNADITVEISTFQEAKGAMAPSCSNLEILANMKENLQETAETFPPTPAQIISSRPVPYDVPSNADIPVEISTPSSSNLETLANRVVSEVGHLLKGATSDFLPESRVKTSVLPVIPKVEPFIETSLNPDPGRDGGDIEKASSECLKQKIQDQGNKHEKEKERQSYETQSTPLEATDWPLDHMMSSSDERPVNSGSNRKRKRRTLLQASSDDDDGDAEASPPSKKKLFTTFNAPAASVAAPLQTKPQQRRSPMSPGSRLAMVRMEFGGGITITEIFAEDPEMAGSKKPLSILKRRASGPAQPGLRQASPTSPYEAEDETESSAGDASYDADSSASSEASSDSDETPERENPEEKVPDYIELSDSELSPPRIRSSARAARTESQGSERSEKPPSSSSNSSGPDREVVPRSVNLLRDDVDEPEEEEEDGDDVEDDLNGFIVHTASSSSGKSDSDGEEQMYDSDSDVRDNRTLREEIVRKRQKLVWDFEGDMLAAIQSHDEIALQAVCALYRQQTEDEQDVRNSLHRNRRGFDKMSAHRGSTFAEFLVGGDRSGQMKKSVKAFQARFAGGLRICQDIAAHHSKQLFEIYAKNEDPLWGRPTDQAT